MGKIVNFVHFALLVLVPTCGLAYAVGHALVQDGFSPPVVGGLGAMVGTAFGSGLVKIYKIYEKLYFKINN